MKRILVGVDGSASANAALAWALDEARAHDATLVVAYAWQPPVVYGSGFAPSPVIAPDGTYEDAAKGVLDECIAAVLVGASDVTVETHLVEGAAGEVLVSLSNDVDLVVVGSRGHGNLVGMLLGSVSQHCAHHSHCPVVIVPHRHE